MEKYGVTGRKPTARQMEVVDAIERLWEECGMAPTLRELAKELGVGSTNAVADFIKTLEKRDMVLRGVPGASRSLMTTRMEVKIEIGTWPWE